MEDSALTEQDPTSNCKGVMQVELFKGAFTVEIMPHRWQNGGRAMNWEGFK
jgi:hypothetical protein